MLSQEIKQRKEEQKEIKLVAAQTAGLVTLFARDHFAMLPPTIHNCNMWHWSLAQHMACGRYVLLHAVVAINWGGMFHKYCLWNGSSSWWVLQQQKLIGGGVYGKHSPWWISVYKLVIKTCTSKIFHRPNFFFEKMIWQNF